MRLAAASENASAKHHPRAWQVEDGVVGEEVFSVESDDPCSSKDETG